MQLTLRLVSKQSADLLERNVLGLLEIVSDLFLRNRKRRSYLWQDVQLQQTEEKRGNNEDEVELPTNLCLCGGLADGDPDRHDILVRMRKRLQRLFHEISISLKRTHDGCKAEGGTLVAHMIRD